MSVILKRLCLPAGLCVCHVISLPLSMCIFGIIIYSSSDINKRINEYYQRTTDQQTHTSAQMIFELVMVRNGGWCLSDDGPVFTKDDISAAIERLCTV